MPESNICSQSGKSGISSNGSHARRTVVPKVQFSQTEISH